MRVTYDPAAGCAAVYVGAPRPIKRTITVGLDEDILIDLDENGQVVTIELLGVSTPSLEMIYRDDEDEPKRNTEDITVKGELL